MSEEIANETRQSESKQWLAQNGLWLGTLAIVCASLALGLHLYRPGFVVEFGDTVFPIHAHAQLLEWDKWWTTNQLGAVWLNSSWIPALLWPSVGERAASPGLAEALQYGFWLGIPALAIAYCFNMLAPRGSRVWALPAVVLAAFNMRVVTQFGGSLEIYTYAGALFVTAALLDALVMHRWRRALASVALAAVVLAPDAANPPYIGVVLLHAFAVMIWIRFVYRTKLLDFVTFAGAALCVAVIVSVRWLVPFVHTLSAYPLTSEGSGVGADYSWVNASASVSNILRDVPVWYWLDPNYGTLSIAYSHSALLKVLLMAPFAAFFMSAAYLAWRRNLLGLGAALLSMVWWFLAKGEHPPLSDVSRAIAHIPFMWLFRDAEKFLIPANICAALTIGVALSAREMGRSLRISIAALAMLGAFGALWPLATGRVFTTPHATPIPYVSIPASYVTLHESPAFSKGCRVLVLPWDRFYEVGYRWGYYGDDTNFVDELVGAPVVHHAYQGYVKNPYAVGFAASYEQALKTDPLAQADLENLYLIGAAVVRRDLQVGVGTDPAPPREADALARYRQSKSDEHLGVFKRECDPHGMTRWFARALRTSPERPSSLGHLVDLGLAGEVLPVATETASDSIETLESRLTPSNVPRRAHSLSTDEVGRATFQRGDYELIVRGLPSQKTLLHFTNTATQIDATSVPVYGVSSGIAGTAPDGRPLLQTFKFVNESSRFARALVHLRILNAADRRCFDIRVNDKDQGKVAVPPGENRVDVTATLKPGLNTMTAAGSTDCATATAAKNEPDRWGGLGTPDSVFAVATKANSRSRSVPLKDGSIKVFGAKDVSAADVRVSVENAVRDPIATLSFQRNDGVPAEVMLRADVAGSGCSTRVLAVADPAASTVTLDLRATLSDPARQSLLTAACRRAKIADLRITALDGLVMFPVRSETSSVTLTGVVVAARRGVESAEQGNLQIAVGGRTFTAPADDVPHRFDVGTLRGTIGIAVKGPLREGLLIQRGLLSRGRPLGGGFSGFHGAVRKGWVLYNQSPERDWQARQHGSTMKPLAAWGTLQAYPVVDGPLDIEMPIAKLRRPLDLLSWAAFAGIILLGIFPRRRAAR